MNRILSALLLIALGATAFAGCIGSNSTSGTDDSNPFPIPEKTTSISGSGATFPKPLLESWGVEFSKLHPSVQVSYAGGGSGKGITDITNKDVLFAGSDAPMSASEKAKATGTILHIPETLGLEALVYNVEGLSAGVHLSGDVVGKIYLGKIKKWNDPQIAALNPDMSLPDKSIAVVYRSDSSGTTYVFTDWLRKTSPDWAATMGDAPSKKPDWTKSTATQQSGNGNDGVGTTVKATPGSIGYVELAYMKSSGLPAASLLNQEGEYLAPTTEGAKKAADTFAANLPAASGDWSKVSITDAPGKGAYPVSSFTYMLVYDALDSYGGKYTAEQLNAFRAWLWWGIHDGQELSEPLGYAKLPESVVRPAEDALNSIRV